MNDRYGLPFSVASQAAADAYVLAVDNLLAAGAGLVESFDAALALDPGCALAEIGRARCLATYGRGAEALVSAVRARGLAAGTGTRERGHVEALALTIEGRGIEALAAIKAHLAVYPRDALVLQPATGIFGLIGFSGRIDRETELLALLDGLAPEYGDDWWFAASRAFAECEAGRLAVAEARVMRSLEAAPHNANAAHVRAHVHYELHQAGAGADFLRNWLLRFPSPCVLRGHLSWHLALWELGMGNAEVAWKLYENEFGAPLRGRGAPTPPLNVLTDAASWLWRAELLGEAERSAEWRAVAAFCADRFPKVGIVFVDIHAALAHARMHDDAAQRRLCDGLASLARERPACEVALALAEGFAAYARGDREVAAGLLASVSDAAVRVGGSRAQRELVDRTLYLACQHARSAPDAGATALLAARPQIASGA